jgi:predicted secreted hydrolase
MHWAQKVAYWEGQIKLSGREWGMGEGKGNEK